MIFYKPTEYKSARKTRNYRPVGTTKTYEHYTEPIDQSQHLYDIMDNDNFKSKILKLGKA